MEKSEKERTDIYRCRISLSQLLFIAVGDDDGGDDDNADDDDDDDDRVVGDVLSSSCCTGKVTTSYLSTTTTLSNPQVHTPNSTVQIFTNTNTNICVQIQVQLQPPCLTNKCTHTAQFNHIKRFVF